MPFNTATVAAATKSDNEAAKQLSYDEALHLIKRFLKYAKNHTVEEVQKFTANRIPAPAWIYCEQATVNDACINKAAELLADHLGPDGIRRFGGSRWWTLRLSPLVGEWVSTKAYHKLRNKADAPSPERIILYIHGGAYYFGSINEHRYQIQRYARKLGGRAFAPEYRLAPQYPAPCIVHDALASYLYLLDRSDKRNCNLSSNQIILMGDSAGAGAVLALSVLIRDMKLPAPAGIVLISPWVDLTHSFPSITADPSGDYIPANGFLHKPSLAWPPPTTDQLREPETNGSTNRISSSSLSSLSEHEIDTGVEGLQEDQPQNRPNQNTGPLEAPIVDLGSDGKVQIKDQIQLYATNDQISHPLVSPALTPSLGGLPPTFVLGGSREMLRDEITFLAHKMANPVKYQPCAEHFQRLNLSPELAAEYSPTKVVLQIYDDCCHVTPTLSFTKPAKYMYRAISQFSIWALHKSETSNSTANNTHRAHQSDGARETNEALERVQLSDQESDISSSSSSSDEGPGTGETVIERLGQFKPKFTNSMIRQRVSTNGIIRDMEPESDLSCLHLPAEQIGFIKPGPVQKWLQGKTVIDKKFAKRKPKIQRLRAKQYAEGLKTGFLFPEATGERPSPSSLASRTVQKDIQVIGKNVEAARAEEGFGMSMWSKFASKS